LIKKFNNCFSLLLVILDILIFSTLTFAGTDEVDIGLHGYPTTIKVGIKQDGAYIIESKNFESDYIPGVVQHEMYPNWHPEAYKAMAVVARTYAEKWKNKHTQGTEKFICNNQTCCQRYDLPTKQWAFEAASTTTGIGMEYDGEVFDACHFGRCDHLTKNSEDKWVNYYQWAREQPCGCEEGTYGHEVGMCQGGAQHFAAKHNYTYEQILKHYYAVKPPIVQRVKVYQNGKVKHSVTKLIP
jgi:peptidoglycan hydrolase-like amidase